jgi:hypothetical protein
VSTIIKAAAVQISLKADTRRAATDREPALEIL